MNNDALEDLGTIEDFIISLIKDNPLKDCWPITDEIGPELETIRTALEQAQEDRAALKEAVRVIDEYRFLVGRVIKSSVMPKPQRQAYDFLKTHAEAVKRAGGE